MKAIGSYIIAGMVLILIMLSGNRSTAAHEGGSAGEEKIVFTKHFQNSIFDVTKRAAYSVEILLDDKEYNIGKNVVGIVIHNAHDKDVIGAKVAFVLRVIPSGTKSVVTPVIADKRNGLYIISGLDLQKEGRRELTMMVKKGSVEDTVKFVFPDALKARVPKGRYTP